MKLRCWGLLVGLTTLLATQTLVMGQDDVSTGPNPLFQSDVGSAYMRGITNEAETEPTRLRIVGVNSVGSSLTFKAIVIDANGNFYKMADEMGVWTAVYGCRGEPLSSIINASASERVWRSATPPSCIEIMIDNSMTSEAMAKDVVKELRDKLPGLSGSDSIGVMLYNHAITEIAPISPATVAASQCNPDNVPAHSGLTATYASMISGIKALNTNSSPTKSLVVIVSSNDVASVTTSTADVVRQARAANVAVHIIKVGSTAQGYVFRYLSAATGGRLYSVASDQKDQIPLIIQEIAYGAKQHIEVTVPVSTTSSSCEDMLVRVSMGIEGTSTVLSDTVLIPLRERSFRAARCIVATFEDSTNRGLQEYYPVLATLAEDLMSDSTKHLRLVGHVSADVKGDADAMATERAGYVRDFLKAYGVKTKQISTVSDGNRKPMYYLQLDGTQRLMNNRVEAFYLDGDEEPFTIVVNQVASEEQAIKDVDSWESRGYKAYFEPVVVKRTPAYRVKLWGYRTESDAQRAVSSIKKYSPPTSIIE